MIKPYELHCRTGKSGEEYELTRHNAGRMVVLELARKEGMGELVFDKKINALVGKGKKSWSRLR